MGRLLGLDYGKKRIGIAVTDELQMLSSPLDVYRNDSFLMKNLKELCDKYKIEKIIIGYPFSETYQEASESVEKFAKELKEFIRIEIEYQNEEFSSVYAGHLLKASGITQKKIKDKIDKYAAQKILDDYLKKGKK